MGNRFSGKMRMVRPADAFLPLSFMIASIFDKADIVLEYFFTYFIIKILALASSSGLRIAFSEQPSLGRAQGSVKAALAMQLLGGTLCTAAWLVYNHFTASTFPLVAMCIGFLLNIEQVFYEYLYATGDSHSALMVRTLTTIFLLAGVLLANHWWQLGMIGVAAIVSVIIGLSIGGPLRGEINGQIFRAAPRALIQALIYVAPAFVFIGLYRFIDRWSGASLITVAPFFAGYAFYCLCASPFRRAYGESSTLNAVLITALLSCGLIAALFHIPGIMSEAVLSTTAAYFAYHSAILIGYAAICAMLLYANFRRDAE